MKYTLYEGGVRGVAALWSPRLQKAARVCNNLIHVTDWLPTLYSAAGGDLKDLGEIDGIDQWRMLRDGQPGSRERLLLNIDEVSRTEGAIYNRFKLLRGIYLHYARKHIDKPIIKALSLFQIPEKVLYIIAGL